VTGADAATPAWRPTTARALLDGLPRRGDRPSIVAVDGRSGSGKTTLATLLARAARPRAAVVHTDDLAWHESMFAWDHLVVEHVFAPLRRREGVDYRPPGWVRRGREGSITVSRGRDLVLLEGVGSARASLRQHVDLVIWVDVGSATVAARDARRIRSGDVSVELAAEWMAEEQRFLETERTWLHADHVVSGERACQPGLLWVRGSSRPVASGNA
jgi:uridine kinase